MSIRVDLLGYPDKATKHNTKHNIHTLVRTVEGPDLKTFYFDITRRYSGICETRNS